MVASSPVSVETIGMRGAEKVSSLATTRNSSSMASMRGEWNAWETLSRLDFRSPNASTTCRTASSSPATTTDDGPLTAAMETRSVRCSSTSASVACRATISPPAGSACIRRPRAPTRVAASSSDSTPETCAAASSPMECPAR